MIAAPNNQATDQSERHNAEQHPHESYVEAHITIQNVAEFMCDDALQFITLKQFKRATCDGDRRVAWRKACRKRIDAAFFFEHVDFRNGHARCDCHLLNDIAQAPPQRILNIGRDQRPTHLPRDGATAGRKGSFLIHAGTEDKCRCQQGHADRYRPVLGEETGGCVGAIACPSETKQRETDNGRHTGNDEDRCNDVGGNQAPGYSARLVLRGEEGHGLIR